MVKKFKFGLCSGCGSKNIGIDRERNIIGCRDCLNWTWFEDAIDSCWNGYNDVNNGDESEEEKIMANYTFDLNNEQLDALKKLGINPIDDNIFPKEGDDYWIVNPSSGTSQCVWCNDKSDLAFMSIGNVFKTQEDAEFELERLKVIAKMRKYADSTLDSGYFIVYYKEDRRLLVDNSKYRMLTDMLFKSFKDVTTCINEVGAENIIKYYFRVKEYV